MVQTKRDIQAHLTAAGVRPLKRFGQHFLIDGNLMRKLIASAGVQPNDVVLEVGPGTGSLTEELVAQAGHVVAVEIDRTLQVFCRSLLAGAANFTLIAADVLDRKSVVLKAVLDELAARQAALGGRILLVANLPYQVATPLIVNLLLGELPVSPMCFTVQKEVAGRFVARPGGGDFGPISVIAQTLAETDRVAHVPPAAFWPEPKVESTMLRVVRLSPPLIVGDLRAHWLRLVHHCFQHRRKMLKASLRSLLGEDGLARVAADGRWNLTARPECLGCSDWASLAEATCSPPLR